MIIFSHAKINLGLQVLSRRKDGYHNIRTVMHPAGLCDILELKESPHDGRELMFSSSGLSLEPGAGKNLCISAWDAYRKEVSLPPLSIHLHKQIPVGAGLGGGSSDATHTLLGLNRIMGEPLGKEDLHRMAAALGSDCPYFLHGSAMLAEGRGEILSPLQLQLKGLSLVLFFDGTRISTAEAYQGIRPAPGKTDLRNLRHLPVREWKERITNDFEGPVYRLYPELENLKQSVYEAGALYASLSGSGSALYGIFKKMPELPGNLQRCTLWKGIL